MAGISLALVMAQTAYADAVLPNLLRVSSLGALITLVARFIFWIAMPVAILMFIYAGFTFMTSGGSPDGVRKGRQILTYAIVGLGIALAAQGFVLVLRDFLT